MRILPIILFLSLFCGAASASLQVVPDGAGTKRVAPKSLDLKAQIGGGFAATTAVWTFFNAMERQFEAELICPEASTLICGATANVSWAA